MRDIVYNKDKIILDGGTYFGKGIFETILVTNKIILLEEHISRANNAIQSLQLGEALNVEEIKTFIDKNNIKDKAIKIVVTEKNIIYSIRDIKYKEHHYIAGFRVKFSKVLRNNTSKLTEIKSLNYLENIMEYELAQSEGFNEALYLNNDGNVAEGCTTNIFLIKDGKIFTPTKESGILPGIIRQWVLDNFQVEEKKITKDELLQADEIFLTNSLVGVIKVNEIEGISFSNVLVDEIRNKYNSFLDGGSYSYE